MGFEEFVNSLTSEEYIRLLDIADPNPMTAKQKAEMDKLTDEELLSQLFAD